MPISEKILQIRRIESGKVKVGGLSPNTRTAGSGRDWRPPVKFKHFMITSTVREAKTGNFVIDRPLMKQLATQGCALADLGEKPNPEIPALVEIPVMLDSDLIEEVFPHSLAAYVGRSGLWCTGNGIKAMRWKFDNNGRRTNEKREVPCTCPHLTDPPKDGPICKPHGTLWFTILGDTRTKIGVYHSFRTTSWNTIRAIVSGLQAIRQMVGTICGIPLWLTFREIETRKKGGDRTTIPVVGIECRTEDLLALQSRRLEAVRGRNAVVQLATQPVRLGLPAPAGPQETAREQAEIGAEYHPEIVDGEPEGETVIEYDPETGEVHEPAPSEAAAPPEEPAKPASAASAEQGKPGSRQNPFLPKNDKLMAKIAERLGDLAEARGFERRDADGFKAALKDVLLQVTTDYCSEPLAFNQLTRKRAEAVLGGIDLEIANAAERAAGEDGEDTFIEDEGEGEDDGQRDEDELLTQDNPAEG